MAKRSRDRWTDEEDSVLRRMKDAGMDWQAISIALGRTLEAVKYRWRCVVPKGERAAGPGGEPWTPEEDAVLKKMAASGATWAETAKAVGGRSVVGCEMRARLLGISRKRKAQEEEPPAETMSRRRCHDCGKPTTDYRCPSCLAAWRRRNGVSSRGEDEDIYTAFGARWAID
jgi:hypothetical protein